MAARWLPCVAAVIQSLVGCLVIHVSASAITWCYEADQQHFCTGGTTGGSTGGGPTAGGQGGQHCNHALVAELYRRLESCLQSSCLGPAVFYSSERNCTSMA